MVAKRYTDEQRDTFLHLAAQVGVPGAISMLGYPSAGLAYTWAENFGVDLPSSPLAKRAVEVRILHDQHTKLVLCQEALDKAYELLTCGEPKILGIGDGGQQVIEYEPLTTQGLQRITASIKNLITTIELLEGRVTNRIEQISHDATSAELIQMINEYKARNAVLRDELEHSDDA